MSRVSIREKCSINSNRDEDTFVGIKCEMGDISINFPIGFDLSNNDEILKKDIFLLISVLESYTKREESELLNENKIYDEVQFPIQSYMKIIRDYYANGYYKEREVKYVVSKKGKINWNRTIKTQRPYIQEKDIFYLDFVVKKNEANENELITLIHEYCVYESFNKIGWLFTKTVPPKPRIKYNYKLFMSVLKAKFSNTYNDKNKSLFRNMIAVLNYQGDQDASKDYRYGTNRFEYVWESMIDKIFGNENKTQYFPKTLWNIKGISYDNACLEPDTIMVQNGNVYVLDAKYYKYGVTGRASDLPESTSINKQITYGEYIANEKKFRMLHGEGMRVFNAFLIPYDALKYQSVNNDKMKYVGSAISEWKSNELDYEQVHGILLDVKYLMNIKVSQDQDEILKLATIIDNAHCK